MELVRSLPTPVPGIQTPEQMSGSTVYLLTVDLDMPNAFETSEYEQPSLSLAAISLIVAIVDSFIGVLLNKKTQKLQSND